MGGEAPAEKCIQGRERSVLQSVEDTWITVDLNVGWKNIKKECYRCCCVMQLVCFRNKETC